jgi:hypothetical protein
VIDHGAADELVQLAEAIARLKPISNRDPHAFYEQRSELASRARAIAEQLRCGPMPRQARSPSPSQICGRVIGRRTIHVDGRSVLVLEREAPGVR